MATDSQSAVAAPCKLVLLGETQVGKSSIAYRFVKGHFTGRTETTIGACYMSLTLTLAERQVKFNIWDTAGQERYDALAPMYYRGAEAAIVVYDVTSEQSFEKAARWITELENHASKDIVIALAGNKVDLCQASGPGWDDAEGGVEPKVERREVSRESAKRLVANDDNIQIFMETSARTGENINDLFVQIAQCLPNSTASQSCTMKSRRGLHLDLKSEDSQEKRRKCC